MEIAEAKRRAKVGPVMLMARRGFAVGITFVSTVTVARLISPREYGLASMAVVLFAFAQMFRDFGITNAVLRKGHVSEEEMTFLFYLNAAMTLVVVLIVVACAVPAANFYSEPIVARVIYVSSIGFLISGLALQHRAHMNRELRFGAIAAIDSIALAVGFAVTLILAYIRRDVWAIVIGTLSQSIAASILYVISSKWKPGKFRKIDDLGDLLRFGANSSVFSICSFISDNAAPILIGHMLGAAPLGQFTRAQALYKLPNTNLVQPIVQSAMPLLARLRQHPEEYRTAYLSLVTRLCTFLFPAAVILTFASVPLIQTLLGSRWYDASLAFMALAPSLLPFAIAYSAGDLFITQNRTGELRTLGIVEMIVRTTAVVAGTFHGLVATALAFTGSIFIAAIIRIWVAGRTGPVTFRDQIDAGIPALPIAIGAAVACTIVRLFVDGSNGMLALTYIAAGGLAGLAVGLAVKPSRHALFELSATFGLDKVVRRLSSKKAV